MVYKAAVSFCLAISMLVFFPPLSEKMFNAGHSLSDSILTPDALQTSGRIHAWAALLDEAMKAPYLGHGGNASEPFLTSSVSEAFAHPHNDYLRLFFDYGLAGLLVFSFTYISIFRRCIESTSIHMDHKVKILQGITFSLFIPFFLLMLMDNILLYSAFFGNIHFLLIGVNESIKRTTRKTLHARHTTTQ
jgi:O-antigen ligase